MRTRLLIIILLSSIYASSAFSIDSYSSEVQVGTGGDLEIIEVMVFDLEEAYEEGYRSIRKEDFGSLSDIVVKSVMVDGQMTEHETLLNGEEAEIVWKKTHAGKNTVTLEYTLKDRAERFDDFARVCYEHYGADWPVSAGSFESRVTLPEQARGKEMHFEIYSGKEGDARVDDLGIVVEMEDVPPGNYVGGCYLYDLSALEGGREASGSALDILEDERESYGSRMILEPEDPGSMALCCLPISIMLALISGYLFISGRRAKRLEESILPPDSEEPVAVSAIVRNKYEDKEIMGATIVSMINDGTLDIIELEKEGADGASVSRERTILLLRKRPEGIGGLKKIVLDMLFPEGVREIDLDGLISDADKIKDKAEAGRNPLGKGAALFSKETERILKEKGLEEAASSADGRWGMLISSAIFGVVIACGVVVTAIDWMGRYLEDGNTFELAGAIASLLLFLISVPYIVIRLVAPSAPKGKEEEFAKWDAFSRAVKASRLKEYPPASAVIWGEILVYATALGMADKVKKHLSELDSLAFERIERMEKAERSGMTLYASAFALHNLATYGSRSGQSSSSGGFSSRSSGGWSSGGGGGFSGGSSGGGGFR